MEAGDSCVMKMKRWCCRLLKYGNSVNQMTCMFITSYSFRGKAVSLSKMTQSDTWHLLRMKGSCPKPKAEVSIWSGLFHIKIDLYRLLFLVTFVVLLGIIKLSIESSCLFPLRLARSGRRWTMTVILRNNKNTRRAIFLKFRTGCLMQTCFNLFKEGPILMNNDFGLRKRRRFKFF